jgi:hypothetical protein
MTQTYLDELVRAFPSIREVWLFGSRANGVARADSDWDYLIFSDDPGLMNCIYQQRHFDRPEVDALVVSGQFAVRPWPMPDGTWKKLRMVEDIQWTPVSEALATYQSAKERSPGSFAVDLHEMKAHRVYRAGVPGSGRLYG